jgi:hypothetical protein
MAINPESFSPPPPKIEFVDTSFEAKTEANEKPPLTPDAAQVELNNLNSKTESVFHKIDALNPKTFSAVDRLCSPLMDEMADFCAKAFEAGFKPVVAFLKEIIGSLENMMEAIGYDVEKSNEAEVIARLESGDPKMVEALKASVEPIDLLLQESEVIIKQSEKMLSIAEKSIDSLTKIFNKVMQTLGVPADKVDMFIARLEDLGVSKGLDPNNLDTRDFTDEEVHRIIEDLKVKDESLWSGRA